MVVVEGEEDEFKLLKHIFVNILVYNYISMKRNKTLQHEFINEQNNNTVIVANTKSSSIKSIVDDDEYKDKLFKLLKMEYNKNLKNTSIYIIWDRDKAKDENGIIKYYIDAIEKFYSPLDNDIDMNGVLLLSYPCHESYNLSNFKKRFWKKNYKTSIECRRKVGRQSKRTSFNSFSSY